MIILMAALVLAGSEPPPDPPADDPAANLAGLQQIYDQSCAAREYGAFDDVCDQLKTQLRQAQRDAASQSSERPPKTNVAPRVDGDRQAGSANASPTPAPPASTTPSPPPAAPDPSGPR